MPSSFVVQLVESGSSCLDSPALQAAKNICSTVNVPVLAHHTLAANIYLSGLFSPPPLCSALGRCGFCRVKFHSNPPACLPQEELVLGKQAVRQGWRLACKHLARAGQVVELPEYIQQTLNPEGKPFPSLTGNTSKNSLEGEFYLAVDFGTTSVHWRAALCSHADFNTRETLLEKTKGTEERCATDLCGQMINPQMGAGSEVMSRLQEAATVAGRERLARLSQNALKRLVENLPVRPSRLCLAANPAMTATFLGLDASSLAAAPYSLPLPGDEEYLLPDLPPVYIPPQLGPFVGGDVCAGLCAVLLGRCTAKAPQYPFLLADLGTNGEFVLALTEDKYLGLSIPLGPALEGAGLACGALAGPGAKAGVITSFELTPTGFWTKGYRQAATEPYSSITLPQSGACHFTRKSEGAEPVSISLQEAEGISASGYLSLLHSLLQCGIIDKHGKFQSDSSLVMRPELRHLQKALLAGLKQQAGQSALYLSEKLYLTSQDIEEILKIKAAFSLALKTLLQVSGLTSAGLKHIFLAGALGRYVKLNDLAGLGFLPPNPALGVESKAPACVVQAIGNASLQGAELFLNSPAALPLARKVANAFQLVDLCAGSDFMEKYLREMILSWEEGAEATA